MSYQIALRGPAPSAEQHAVMAGWVERATGILAPLGSGSYINFPDSTPSPRWQEATYGENYPRLVETKRRYDPAGMFRHPQSIGS